MNSVSSRIAKVLFSIVLACFLIPVQAVQAFAASGVFTFAVDGIVYQHTVNNLVYVHGYEEYDDVAGIVTIPSTVEYNGETFTVNGVDKYAFQNCTQLEELRISIPQADGTIQPTAFQGCTNMRALHLMTSGTIAEREMHITDDIAYFPEGLNIIVHAGSWNAQNRFEGMGEGGVIAPGLTTYYAVTYKTSSGDTTIYVKGPSAKYKDQSSNEFVEGTPASKLGSLTDEDVYCDADLGADSICPNSASSIASLNDDQGWAFTSADGDLYRPSEGITAPGTAAISSAKDLSYGEIDLSSDTVRFVDAQVTPEYSVLNINGKAVDGKNYSVSFFTATEDEDGEIVFGQSVSAPKDPGGYALKITGNSATGYSGSTSVYFEVVKTLPVWTRPSLTSSNSVAFSANRFAASLAGDAVSAENIVFVNPDSEASCALALSLAGNLNCLVVPTDGSLVNGALPSEVAMELVYSGGVDCAYIVGGEAQISSAFQSALGANKYAGSVARIAASANPAEEAVQTDEFANSYLELESWGKQALILPESMESKALYAVMSWAYANKAAVFFASEQGALDTASSAAVSKAESVVIAGFDQASANTLKSALPQKQTVSVWTAQGSEQAQSSQYAAQACGAGEMSEATAVVATGSDDAALLAAAVGAGILKGSLLLATNTSYQDAVSYLKDNLWQLDNGIVVASKDDLKTSTLNAIEDLWGMTSGEAEDLQKPSKVKLSKVTSPKKSRVKVVWKKVSQASGYQVSFVPKVGKKKTVTVKAKKLSTVAKGFKSKKPCVVKVRAWVKSGSTVVYGKWSASKKVKVK